MAEYKDSVKDQTTTTGTGTLTIAGVAPAGARTMASAHTNGATVRYRINTADQSQWEVGQGVWNPPTLSRDIVYASSNAGALVNFTSGTKAVITGLTAADMVMPGLVLLATLSPTAAVNVDALTVFSSSYDNYLIIGNGINFAADEGIVMRVAVAGTVDVTGNYIQCASNSGESTSTSSSIGITGGTVRSAGKGAGFIVTIVNANDSSRIKLINSKSIWHSTVATGGFTSNEYCSAYIGNAISGVRFSSAFGNNFSATGKIRIYGYMN